MKRNAILRLTRNPSNDFKGLPFWAWNGKLEEKELRRQIGIFREMGFGGFFMHARTGLNTDYLSDEFFRCVNSCIDEAEKHGLKAWLYDEDRYSSGSAGGRTADCEAFRRRSMKVEILDSPVFRPEDFSWFAGKVSGTKLYSPRRLRKGGKLRPGESFLRFYVEICEPDSWNNGGCYADLMNPDAMRRFIEITHERYAENCRDSFGKTAPGFFSDEPNCSNWTDGMEKIFAERCGISLSEKIPELFFEIDGEECSLLRWRFNNLRIELLCEAFAKPVAEWCRAHNLLFTGHVFGEESVLSQTLRCPSAMRFAQYMDLPGVDLLGELWPAYDAMIQISSVAHQKGTNKVISESFAGCGWDFSLEAQKATADWQAALGVTILCQHLAFYTMEGCAKRDYPPSISYQSPWFRAERKLQDYFARLGGILNEGKAVRKILVVHPLESTWFWKNPSNLTEEEADGETKRLPRVRNALLSAHLAFDYGEEDMMAHLGSVSANGHLSVGKAEYELVILPRMRTIRSTTLDLLEEFTKSGGKVLFAYAAPEFVDGVKSNRAKELFRKAFIRSSLKNLARDTEAHSERTVSVFSGREKQEIPSILVSESVSENDGILFLCSTGMPLPDFVEMGAPYTADRTLVFPDAQILWRIPASHRIYEIDPETGDIFAVKSVFREGRHLFESPFGRLETHLYWATEEKLRVPTRKNIPESANVKFASDGRFRITPDEPNVLVLDFLELSIAGSSFSPPQFVLDADSQIRDFLKIPRRTHLMIEPWMRKYAKDDYSKSVPIRFRCSFECDSVPEKLVLAVEHPEAFSKITLNGKNVSKRDAGWWCDNSLRKLDLPQKALKEGKNVLEFECTYSGFLCGLESMFLLGDFSVLNDRIGEPVRELVPGDWRFQGFPYYSGNIAYHFLLEWNEKDSACAFLRIPAWKGGALGISINASEMKYLVHAPYETEISKLLKPGRNDVSVTVFGSRRNSFGPFFQLTDRCGLIGPEDYEKIRFNVRMTSPYGLFDKVELLFENKKYKG